MLAVNDLQGIPAAKARIALTVPDPVNDGLGTSNCEKFGISFFVLLSQLTSGRANPL